jgi:hypothetical protein
MMLLSGPNQAERNEIQVAVCQYFAQGSNIEPDESSFSTWLVGLPAKQRIISMVAGFEAANQNLSFRRYVLELHGFCLYEYMTAHLSPTALHFWLHRQEVLGIWGASLNPNEE